LYTLVLILYTLAKFSIVQPKLTEAAMEHSPGEKIALEE
jgi:hypothetical protein